MSEGELVDDGGNYDDDRWEEIGENSTWILSSAFMILTMQSGFALLEAGYSAPRNMTNVLMKNLVDVIVGGMSIFESDPTTASTSTHTSTHTSTSTTWSHLLHMRTQAWHFGS